LDVDLRNAKPLARISIQSIRDIPSLKRTERSRLRNRVERVWNSRRIHHLQSDLWCDYHQRFVGHFQRQIVGFLEWMNEWIEEIHRAREMFFGEDEREDFDDRLDHKECFWGIGGFIEKLDDNILRYRRFKVFGVFDFSKGYEVHFSQYSSA
jgi:hypothetical protein